MRPNLDAVEALDAVIRHGGVAKAAVHLHKVQSAVTYQIQKLEQQLGIALLDRSGYRIKLTAAGEAILAEGRRLIAQAEHVASVAQQFVGGWEPKLTLVLDGILPLEPTLRALKTLADERIPTCIQVKVEFLGGVQFRFEQDAADLMFVKDYEPSPQLEAEALPYIDCVLCAAPQHPLSAVASVSLRILQEHVELSVQDSRGPGNSRHMFGGERVFYLSGFIAKKEALLMGLGFGWMPYYLVHKELRSGALRELDFVGGSRYQFTPLLVHRLDRPLGRTATRFGQLLRAGYSAMDKQMVFRKRGIRQRTVAKRDFARKNLANRRKPR